MAAKSYKVVSQVSVDSLGGDEEKYQKFLERRESQYTFGEMLHPYR
ncbi:MAG: hypothetical protein WBG66_17155 [Geitlerinemataceae cyanobacterium]